MFRLELEKIREIVHVLLRSQELWMEEPGRLLSMGSLRVRHD